MNHNRQVEINPVLIRSVQVLLVVVAIAQPANCQDGGSQKLVRIVRDAIESNYSLIDSAIVTIHETRRDNSVKSDIETRHTLPGGGAVIVKQSPLVRETMQVWLAGSKVRFERKDPGIDQDVREVLNVLNGVWTQYVPDAETAWLRRQDGMPSMFPIDPRECGTDDVRVPMLSLLQRAKVKDAKLEPEQGANVVKLTLVNEQGAEAFYAFSSTAKFLPTEMKTTWDDGSLLQRVNYEYQPVLGGKALFLRRLTRRFYPKGTVEEKADAGWRQELVRNVVGKPQINARIDPSQFTVALPPGTRINNSTQQVALGSLEPSTSKASVGILVNVGAVLALLSLVIRRSLKRGRSNP